MSTMLWNLLDHYMVKMAQSGDPEATIKEVRLSELLSQSDLVDIMEDMSVREFQEYTLNAAHE